MQPENHNIEADEVIPAEPLKFYSDKGSERAKWIAGFLVLLLLGWMGSGFIVPSQTDEDEKTAAEKVQLLSVAIRDSVAKPVTLSFNAEGQALPDRETIIRAETSGNIVELMVQKGQLIKEGQVLAKFDAPQKLAEVKRAEEELRRTTIDYENAKKLLDQGVATTKRVNDAKSAMVSAEAQVSSAKENLSNITVTAPFTGRLESLSIDQGEFVQAGAEIGKVVDNDPLTISIQVPQQSLSQIKTGQKATINFITGQTAEGEVSFVSNSANAETRTFLAEIIVNNTEGNIATGVSATVSIPTLEAQGHFISPAILSLNADGILGIKTVDENNRVVFHKVNIIRAQTDGLWVSGLDDQVKIISIGQGFVKDGEEVIAVPEEAMAVEAKKQAKPANENTTTEKTE